MRIIMRYKTAHPISVQIPDTERLDEQLLSEDSFLFCQEIILRYSVGVRFSSFRKLRVNVSVVL